ncbi:hypothetical protein [Ferruginibacter albus]|uniref:hypothetical protein n=1 Tax=Ferruginibacter albus TaxID=2875540 RepID=UPI001CC6F029|nr:hypothetical protein [Ferruginibacter albus]UAY53199.1 hypothetical protein K9M53_05890 [Ferruginibacter albus]
MNHKYRRGHRPTNTEEEQMSPDFNQNAMSDKEKSYLELANGKKAPKTESEKKLVKEVEEAKKKGKIIYVPYD